MAAAAREELWTSPAAASTAIAPLITGPVRPAEVIAEFPVARYLRVDEAVLALVTPAAVRLPNALVCRELPPVTDDDHVSPRPVITGTLHTMRAKSAGDQRDGVLPLRVDGRSALVGDGYVQFGRARVVVGRWWDPVPRLPPVDDLPGLVEAVETMRSLLPTWPDSDEPAAAELIVGREALTLSLAGEGTPAAAADQLVGLGPGLTPAGDDLLAGAVAGLVIFGCALGRRGSGADRTDAQVLAKHLAAAVDARADRTTLLAADLAHHAAAGALAEPVAAVCRALAGRKPLESALDRLLAIGHTSGRDLAEGLLLGATAAITV
jgi:hypothetical protein